MPGQNVVVTQQFEYQFTHAFSICGFKASMFADFHFYSESDRSHSSWTTHTNNHDHKISTFTVVRPSHRTAVGGRTKNPQAVGPGGGFGSRRSSRMKVTLHPDQPDRWVEERSDLVSVPFSPLVRRPRLLLEA